jgi:hypothetical protein
MTQTRLNLYVDVVVSSLSHSFFVVFVKDPRIHPPSCPLLALSLSLSVCVCVCVCVKGVGTAGSCSHMFIGFVWDSHFVLGATFFRTVSAVQNQWSSFEFEEFLLVSNIDSTLFRNAASQRMCFSFLLPSHSHPSHRWNFSSLASLTAPSVVEVQRNHLTATDTL